MMRTGTIIFLSVLVTAPAFAAEEGEWDPNKGIGFHQNVRVSLGYFRAEVPGTDPTIVDGMTIPRGPVQTKNVAMLQFDGVFLGLASVYGNWHGIETSVLAFTDPWDFQFSLGMPFTMLTLGDGGFATTRIGGSFGMGVGLRQAFAYVKGRIAGVVIPGRVDGEASVTWTPASASAAWGDNGDLEDLQVRASGFLHMDAYAGRGYEVYVEYFERQRKNSEEPNDAIEGFVAGVGLTW